MRIKLDHVVHPVRTANSVRRRVEQIYNRQIIERRLRQVRRGRRERCWCGGQLSHFPWHASYGLCTCCGCYINQRPPLIEDMGLLYSFDLYWHARQKAKGHPAIERRSATDHSDGRVDYWIQLISRFGPARGRVIEVGCAHGVFLQTLSSLGYQCVGVEPDERTAAWAREHTGLDIRAGFFPKVELPDCDIFMAFDVIEHTADPCAFLKAAANLLRPGGTVILQTPIDRYDYKPPFGERFNEAFDDMEHLVLFTNKAMEVLARESGLHIVSNDGRLWLHHEVCVLRKP